MLKPLESVMLAWQIIDAASKDPQYADQLTGEQWKSVGRYMAGKVHEEREIEAGLQKTVLSIRHGVPVQ